MQMLVKLMLKLQSDAKAFQQASDKSLKRTATELAITIDNMAGLWKDCERDVDFDSNRISGLLRGFWCQVLSQTYMPDSDEYLYKCSTNFLRIQAQYVSVCLQKVAGDKTNNRSLHTQMTEIAEHMVKASKEVRGEARHVRRFIPVPDYSDTVDEDAPPPAIKLSSSRPGRFKMHLAHDSSPRS